MHDLGSWENWRETVAHLTLLLGIFIGILVTLRVGHSAIRRSVRFERDSARLKTVTSILDGAWSALVWFVGLAWMLETLGVNLAPILASAGVFSLALAFGAQTLAKDLVTGLFLVVEDQFQVGEFVEMGGAKGRVETLGLRTTQMRDELGRLITLPNSTITQVVNYSRGSFQLAYDVRVDGKQDLGKLADVLKGLAETPGVVAGPEVAGLASVGDGKQVVRVVTRVDPSQRLSMENTLRLKLKQALDAADIAWL